MIHVEEQALADLKGALGTAGKEYLDNYKRLTNLINEITRGDITGPLADEFLKKFNDKKGVLMAVANTIEEAEHYTGMQQTGFGITMEETQAGMR